MKQHTWVHVVDRTISQQQEALLEEARNIIQSSGPSLITAKARKLITMIDKEAHERFAIAGDLQRRNLAYEGIIKKDLFLKLVKKIDTKKELFFFSQIDEKGMVYGHTRPLHESGILDKLREINAMGESEIWAVLNSEFARDFVADIATIDRDSKNLLWPGRSDMFTEVGVRRKVPIKLLKAPKRFNDRILSYKDQEHRILWLVHHDSFVLSSQTEEVVYQDEDGDDVYARKTYGAFCETQRKIMGSIHLRLFNEESPYSLLSIADNTIKTGHDGFQLIDPDTLPQWKTRRACLAKMKNAFSILEKALTKHDKDPVAMVELGDWFVIVDQYGSFDKEREVVEAVKKHYEKMRNTFLLSNN